MYKKVLEDRRSASVVQRTRTSRKRKAPSFSRRGSLEDQFRKGPGPHFMLNLSIDRTTYQRVMFHISSTTRLCFFLSNLIAPCASLGHEFQSHLQNGICAAVVCCACLGAALLRQEIPGKFAVDEA